MAPSDKKKFFLLVKNSLKKSYTLVTTQFSRRVYFKTNFFKIPLKTNIPENERMDLKQTEITAYCRGYEIPERGLGNPQMSRVGPWNRRRPSQLPLLLYTLYLICIYI